jgi:hypothetical protein
MQILTSSFDDSLKSVIATQSKLCTWGLYIKRAKLAIRRGREYRHFLDDKDTEMKVATENG